ncbi:MAG: ABC transporter ATP-binding protein [bacterium]
MILLEKISKTFRDGGREIKALDGVELQIAAGTVMALMGRSGSGKSTLLHLIGGLEWPSAGRVTVAGVQLDALSDAQITRFRLNRIGFVFQFFQLLPGLSVLENLLLPAGLAGVPRRQAAAKARQLLAAVGIGDRLGAYPDSLSGGEQQRAAIARGLMLDPPVLLADEPTGNLDSETGRQVLALILGLAESRGATVIIATHSAEIAALASRVVELRDGRVVRDSGGVRPSPPGAAGPAGPGP